MALNVLDHTLLRCSMLLAPLYRRMGAHPPHLQAILVAQLMADNRQRTGFNAMRHQKPDREVSNATFFTIGFSLLIGLVCLSMLGFSDDLTRMTAYFSLFAMMLALMLITDFSRILFDARDQYVLLTKPIHPATLLIARLLHMSIHLAKILIPMALPGFVALWVTRHFAGAADFIPAMFMLILLVFAAINGIYLFLIRIISPARLNALISTIQIVFAVLAYGAYFMLPRIVDTYEMGSMSLGYRWYLWLWPPYWLAAFWEFLYSGSAETILVIGTGLSIAMPLLTIWLVVKYLAPAFLSRLSLIQERGETQRTPRPTKDDKSGLKIRGWIPIIATLFTRQGVERVAFLHAWRITSRDRDFKMKVYPQVGYVLVLVASLLFAGKGKQLQTLDWHNMGRLKFPVLVMMYLSCFVCYAALFQLPYHKHFKAAGIFLVAPLRRPGRILQGAAKACLVKFLFPAFIIIGALLLVLLHLSFLPNLLLGFAGAFVICMSFAWFTMDRLPFSTEYRQDGEGKTTLRNVFLLIILPFFAIPHGLLLWNHPVLELLISIPLILGGLLALHFLKNIRWGYIGSSG